MSKYWIDPYGEAIFVADSHEEFIRHNLARFGLRDGRDIRFGDIFRKGWIRVRIYTGELSFETARLDADRAGHIVKFLQENHYKPDTVIKISAVGKAPKAKVYELTVGQALQGGLKGDEHADE